MRKGIRCPGPCGCSRSRWGRNAQTGELLPDATSCPMCRRHIINAGLERVVIRRTPTEFQVVDVQDWIDSEDDAPQA